MPEPAGLLDSAGKDPAPYSGISGSKRTGSKTLHDPVRQYLDSLKDPILSTEEEVELGRAFRDNTRGVTEGVITTGYGARKVLDLMNGCLSGRFGAGGGKYTCFWADYRDVLEKSPGIMERANELLALGMDRVRAVVMDGLPEDYKERARGELAGMQKEWAGLIMPLGPAYDIIVNNFLKFPEHATIRSLLRELGEYRQDLLGLEARLHGCCLRSARARIASEVLDTPEHFLELMEGIEAMHEKREYARERLTGAHLRLVVKMAKKHTDNHLEMLDFIEFGNMALLRAVEDYDPESGNRFSTYATGWIRSFITRGRKECSRTVRLSLGAYVDRSRISKVVKRMENDMEYPDLDGAAEEAGIAAKRARDLMRPDARSLEYVWSGFNENDFKSFLEKGDSPDPLRELELEDSRERIRGLVGALNQRERYIISNRFGLGGGSKTLRECGRVMGLTRERVRQIEKGALSKLRERLLGTGLEPEGYEPE